MSNEFLDALRNQTRPGFNKLERDWHYDRFYSEARQSDALVELVGKISVGLNEPKEKAAQWVLEAAGGDVVASARLVQWLPEVSALDDAKSKAQYHTAADMAAMILCSRLPIDWVISKRTYLEETYCIEFDDSIDWDALKKERPKEFLKSAARWKVINSITEMLPGQIIDEIRAYHQYHLFDGKNPDEVESEPVGKGSAPPSTPESTESDSANTGSPLSEPLQISA